MSRLNIRDLIWFILTMVLCMAWSMDHEAQNKRASAAWDKSYREQDRILVLETLLASHGHEIPPEGWKPDITESLQRLRDRRKQPSQVAPDSDESKPMK
jgi:hypothetical protein